MTGRNDKIILTPKALLALMLAILGSPVVSALYTQYRTEPQVVRPDQFTGADGRALRADLERQIDQLTRRVDAIRADVNLCLLMQHAAD